MRFADNLRNLRLQRGMTQMQLAESLNTSQSAITSWENGRREPDFRTIRKIADFFHVPMTALLPSTDAIDMDYVNSVAESFQQNPYLKLLFDRLRYMSDKNLKVIMGVANALAHYDGEGI